MNYKLTFGWLYPELMSTYGDHGNIIVLQKRCEWREIRTVIIRLDLHFNPNQLSQCDLLFMGGAQDRQQQIVGEDLMGKRDELKQMIENNVPGLYICGAYQFLGKYYKEADGTIIPGLNILDLYTENPGINKPRLIGNVAIKCHPEFISGSQTKGDSDFRQNDNGQILVGFENHGGRTCLGKNVKPLGKVIKGFGNNGEDGTEGAIYKNSFGTYLHGPILPKNPDFADCLISLALKKKFGKEFCFAELPPLNDKLELQAREFILKNV